MISQAFTNDSGSSAGSWGMKTMPAAIEPRKIGSRHKIPFLYPNVENAYSVMYG